MNLLNYFFKSNKKLYIHYEYIFEFLCFILYNIMRNILYQEERI